MKEEKSGEAAVEDVEASFDAAVPYVAADADADAAEKLWLHAELDVQRAAIFFG